jgi:hypothetical protein
MSVRMSAVQQTAYWGVRGGDGGSDYDDDDKVKL